MVSRRYAAAFLVFTAAFLATAILLSNSQFAFAVGTVSDQMCGNWHAECGCGQIPNPNKAAGQPKCIKGANTNKCPEGICFDDTNDHYTTGICVAKNKCQALHCDGKACGGQAGGGSAGAPTTEPPSGSLDEETPQPNGAGGAPQMPQPPAGGGDSPQPKPDETPKPNGADINPYLQNPQSGEGATNNSESLTPSTPKTNSFGDFLSGQAPSWLSDSATPAADPFGQNSAGIGNYFGAQTLEPTTPSGSSGSESPFGNSNPSLLEQATNPAGDGNPGFTNPTGESTPARETQSVWGQVQELYNSTVAAAQDVVQAVKDGVIAAGDYITNNVLSSPAGATEGGEGLVQDTPAIDQPNTDPFAFQETTTGFNADPATIEPPPATSDIASDGAPVVDNSPVKDLTDPFATQQDLQSSCGSDASCSGAGDDRRMTFDERVKAAEDLIAKQVDAAITSNAAQIPIENAKADYDAAKAAAETPIAERESAERNLDNAAATLKEWQETHPPVKTETTPDGKTTNYYTPEDLKQLNNLQANYKAASDDYTAAVDTAKPFVDAQNAAAENLNAAVASNNRAAADAANASAAYQAQTDSVKLGVQANQITAAANQLGESISVRNDLLMTDAQDACGGGCDISKSPQMQQIESNAKLLEAVPRAQEYANLLRDYAANDGRNSSALLGNNVSPAAQAGLSQWNEANKTLEAAQVAEAQIQTRLADSNLTPMQRGILQNSLGNVQQDIRNQLDARENANNLIGEFRPGNTPSPAAQAIADSLTKPGMINTFNNWVNNAVSQLPSGFDTAAHLVTGLVTGPAAWANDTLSRVAGVVGLDGPQMTSGAQIGNYVDGHDIARGVADAVNLVAVAAPFGGVVSEGMRAMAVTSAESFIANQTGGAIRLTESAIASDAAGLAASRATAIGEGLAIIEGRSAAIAELGGVAPAIENGAGRAAVALETDVAAGGANTVRAVESSSVGAGERAAVAEGGSATAPATTVQELAAMQEHAAARANLAAENRVAIDRGVAENMASGEAKPITGVAQTSAELQAAERKLADLGVTERAPNTYETAAGNTERFTNTGSGPVAESRTNAPISNGNTAVLENVSAETRTAARGAVQDFENITAERAAAQTSGRELSGAEQKSLSNREVGVANRLADNGLIATGEGSAIRQMTAAEAAQAQAARAAGAERTAATDAVQESARNVALDSINNPVQRSLPQQISDAFQSARSSVQNAFSGTATDVGAGTSRSTARAVVDSVNAVVSGVSPVAADVANVFKPTAAVSQTVGATEGAVARFNSSSWSRVASEGAGFESTGATSVQTAERAGATTLGASTNPFVNAAPVAALAPSAFATNAVAAPSSVTQTSEGTVAIAADGSESFTPASQAPVATEAPAPTGSTVADAVAPGTQAAPSVAAPATAAPTPSATTPAPSAVGSAPAAPVASAPSPGSVATVPSAPATSPSGQQAVQTAPEQKQTNSWSQWFSSLPNQVGNPFVSSSQAAPFVNSVADRINVASQETGNRQASRAYSSDVATNMAEGVRLVCQATGCDATTYAQALGGSCAQESGGCDPTYKHGSSQYQGLGQLSRESASNANRALARVRESPNLTTAERADIDGVIQRTNAWLAGKSAVDPRFAPKDGSYLFAARHTYMPEMGTTPLANIQRAAPGDAATQARLIQLTQLAPSIHNTGQINNWDAPLTASQRSALSNNKLSGATTVREAIAKMNATNYAGKLDSGVAWMNRELANQTGFPSSPVVVSPQNTITSPTTPANGKTLSPRTDATPTTNPVVKVLDAISKTIGTAVKNNKSPNDRALDMVATLKSGNPNMLASDVAARLENAGLKDTEAFTAQRELSAREIENVPTATAGGIAKADASIAKTVANIKANQGIADTLANKGLVPKGSTATANANGSYNVVTPNGASYTLAQTAPAAAKPVVLNQNATYSMAQLRGMNAPELNRFIQATQNLAGDRFATGKVIAANIDVINAFFSQFNRVPEINGLGRSAAVNSVVGGDPNSDHLTGNATDWKTVGVPAKQTQALNKILADRGFDLVTHSHGQGPHTHASMNRAALSNELPNLNITQNIPPQFALTNTAGKQVGPTVAMTTGNNISNIALKPAPVETWVSTDLKTMIETSLAYNARTSPQWPTPTMQTPQLTVTPTAPLTSAPVAVVTRGQDLPEPGPANPVPNVTNGGSLADVKPAPVPEPGPANPVPTVTNGGPLADVPLPNDPKLTPETTLVGTLPPTPTVVADATPSVPPTPTVTPDPNPEPQKPTVTPPVTEPAKPTVAVPDSTPVDTAAIQKKLDDARASITKTKADINGQKNQLSTVNGKIADIQKQTHALNDAKTNAAIAERGLRVLEGLWGQPNPAERAALTNGTAAAARLANNAQQLGNSALANQIRSYVNLLNSMSKPDNQTLANRNAAVSQGNSLVANARTLINTSAAKIAALGNLGQLQTTQKTLNDQVSFSNKTLAQLQADEKAALAELNAATDNTVATAPVPETTPQPAPSTPVPETVTVTETTPAPETIVVATPPSETLTLPPNYSPDVTTVTPGKTYTYAQPINMKGMIFAALGMRTYLPASMLAKLEAATLETQDITFTKAEMDAVQWGKMDKNSYAMLQLILNPDPTLKTGYVAPVPNGEITPGKQILTDIADNVGGAKFTGSPTVVAPSDTLTSADTAAAPRPTVSKSDIPPSAPMRTSEETAQLIKDYGLTKMNPAVAQSMLPPAPAPIARLKPGSHPMMSADMKTMTDDQLGSWVKDAAELLQDQAALVFGSHGAPYRRGVVEIVNAGGSSFDRKDGKIRIDLSQIRDSRYENVKASRAAYIVGHEIGHYIAEVTGVDMSAYMNLWTKKIVPPITEATAYDNEAIAELQADYIAGVLLRESGLMQADDVKDMYYGIAASGDDFILSKYSDVEVPRSFSGHATGALRAQMFHDGVRVGTVESGLEFYGYQSPPIWNSSTPVAWDKPSLPDTVTTVAPKDTPAPPQLLPGPTFPTNPTNPTSPVTPSPTFPSSDLDTFVDNLYKGRTDLNGPGIGTNPVPDMPGLPVQSGRITTQTKTKTDEIETVTNPPEYPVALPPSGGSGATPPPLPVQPPPLPTQLTNAQSSWMKILGTTGGIIAAGYIVSLPSGDSSQSGFGTSPTPVAPKDTPTKPPATPGPGVPSTEGILFPKTTGPGIFPPVPKPDTPKPDTPSPKPDAPKVVPKPADPKTAPPTPRTGPVPQPKPNPQPGTSVPTGQSVPTSGAGGQSGGALNSIMSFLSGLLKGMAGMLGPQPIQPTNTPTGTVSVQIYAVPNPVASSSTSVITWTSVNAASCSLLNASSTPVASGMTNSSFTVSSITATTTYSISCSNQTGSFATGSVIILVQ